MTSKIAETLIASTNFLALPIERDFRPEPFIDFAKNNWALAIGLVVAYMVFISAGSAVMKSRNAFDLRLPLAGWNAFLCIFSFLGMCRTVSDTHQSCVYFRHNRIANPCYCFFFIL